MAGTTRKRDLLSSRRRLEDEGEDEEGVEDLGDESQSEASILTVDDIAAADESDLSEISKSEAALPAKANCDKQSIRTTDKLPPSAPTTNGAVLDEPLKPIFSQNADVEAMVNGLKINDTTADEEVLEFEDSADVTKPATTKTASHQKPDVPSGPQRGRGARQQNRSRAFRSPTNANSAFQSGAITTNLPDVATEEALVDAVPAVTSQPSGRGIGRGRGAGIMNNGSLPYVIQHNQSKPLS